MLKRPTYDTYKTFIYDYNTSNASFIAMAALLRRMGVKNYKFFLKLYDPDLVEVDPFDEDLSMEMKIRIIEECRKNFWYFIREVMRIPASGSPVRFALHRGNLAAAWSFSKNIPTYLVLPRQHGKTWTAIAFALWVLNFATTYTNMLFMNKSQDDSQRNLASLKEARALLPEYLRMDKEITNKGTPKDTRSNVRSIENSLHNKIFTRASASSEGQAENVGRGMTVAWVWLDEFAFINYNETIYMAMSPAWTKAAEVAIKNGKPVGKILTTTPNDLSSPSGSFAYQVRADAAKFDESLYDKDSEDFNNWLEKNTKIGYLYIEFMYYQLDHKDPDGWYEEQCRQLLYNRDKIRREILIQWNNASNNSPFDEEDIRELQNMKLKPLDNESITINKYYKLNVYRKLDVGSKYIISVDVAKGRGAKSDNTVVCVTDARTNLIHAIFKSNTIQYKETFRFLYTLVYQYIPNSVLIIENNIDTLIEYIKNSTMRHLLYYEFSRDVTKDKRSKGILMPNRNDSIIYGINTNSQNRPKYFDILFEYVRNYKEYVCVEDLLDEICTLEYKNALTNGGTRIEAAQGMHDDVVLAYLIGQYVMQYGTNKIRFGLVFASDNREVKELDTAKIGTRNIISDANSRNYTDVTFINPFWLELIQRDKTDEELELEWQRAQVFQSGDEEAIMEYKVNVFTGVKNEIGLSTIRNETFFDLNARDTETPRDTSQPYDVYDDFSDNDNGWF